MGEAGAKRGRGRPKGSTLALIKNPDRQEVAHMSATEAIMEIVGIEFEPHYAAKLAALRVRLVPDRVAFDAKPDAGMTRGANPRARPLDPGLREHGGIDEEFDQPRGQRRGEHIFVAADRIEEAWKRVPGFPHPDAIWRAQAALAWTAMRAPLIIPDLQLACLARELFEHDPKSCEAWLKLGSDPTRLSAYFAVVCREVDFWRQWCAANPDPPQEVSIVAEAYQVSPQGLAAT